jgi:hypothetical protein
MLVPESSTNCFFTSFSEQERKACAKVEQSGLSLCFSQGRSKVTIFFSLRSTACRGY